MGLCVHLENGMNLHLRIKKEQSYLGLHCLPRPVCPKTEDYAMPHLCT